MSGPIPNHDSPIKWGIKLPSEFLKANITIHLTLTMLTNIIKTRKDSPFCIS